MRRGRRIQSAPASGVEEALQRIEALHHRGGRDRAGRYYVEGIRFLLRAAERGVAIETLVVSWKLLIHPKARQLVRRLRRGGTPTLLVTPEQFRAVSQRPRASGVGLVLRQHWSPSAAIDPRRGTAWLLLREVQSPGNLGTLLRTLAAVGGGGALFLGDEADPFHPAVLRATMGAVFDLALARVTPDQLRLVQEQTACRVLGTSPHAATEYTDAPWGPGSILFLGGERRGISAADAGLCDLMVRIPMTDAVDSLNLGVAGSLMLYEALRTQRPSGSRGLPVT